jgi:hypothetical protein
VVSHSISGHLVGLLEPSSLQIIQTFDDVRYGSLRGVGFLHEASQDSSPVPEQKPDVVLTFHRDSG